MKQISHFILLLVLITPSYALINEIMYNPVGSDIGHEWIEIYNGQNTQINLSKWKFYESGINHGLTLKQGVFLLQPDDYAIICDNSSSFLSAYPDFSGNLIQSSFSLSNTGENLVIKNEFGEVVDNIIYSNSTGGNGNGFSIGLVNDLWKETIPTPGKANVPKQESNTNDTNASNNVLDENKTNETLEEMENQNSLIQIIDAPSSAYFGDLIYVTFFVYRGNTSKYAIYTYVKNEDSTVSSKNSTHFKTKFANSTFTVPIQLNSKCYDEGSYSIVVEGLDTKDEKLISLMNINDCNIEKIEEKTISGKKFVYELVSKPDYVHIGDEFEIQVRIETSEDTNLVIWSYVYRGSKCYSGERESNAKSVSLKAGSTEMITLKNSVIEGDPGDYKLKVKIQKDDLKTLKEITTNITVVSAEQTVAFQQDISNQDKAPKESSTNTEKTTNKISGMKDVTCESIIVYESTQQKAERLVVYFMLGLLASTTIFLAFKKLN